MRLLFDTHAFLWFINDDPQLSVNAKSIIEDAANDAFLSIASVWEIAIKASLGKLQVQFPATFEEFITQQLTTNNIILLDISPSHFEPLFTLPFHHRDPFDRLLIAQAITEQLGIISVDGVFDQYPIMRYW